MFFVKCAFFLPLDLPIFGGDSLEFHAILPLRLRLRLGFPSETGVQLQIETSLVRSDWREHLLELLIQAELFVDLLALIFLQLQTFVLILRLGFLLGFETVI